jgi:hypothetical protein
MAMHGLTPPDGGDGPGSEAAVDMDHHVVGPDGMIVKTFSTKAAADKFAAKNKWHRVVSTPKGTLAEPTDGMED